MNNKIMKRGKNVTGLVRYLFGKGDANEHTGQRIIAAAPTLGIADGTRLDRRGDWPRVLDVARDLDAHRRIAGVAPHDGWVWHCAISLPPGERLDDAQWADVARTAIHRLGFDADDQGGRAGCRWIAVHHGPSARGNDHIHLAVNLVRDDLTIAAPGRDRIAMSRLCGEMERRYGLHVVEGRPGRGMPGYTHAAKERAERAHRRARTARTARTQDRTQGRDVGEGAGRAVPETATLARKIRAAATAATDEAEFVQAAVDAGIWVRPRYGKGGDRSQVVGYSAALPGSDAGAGPIWYGGGKLAADLSLPRLRARWTTSPKTTPPGALPAWQHANDLAAGPASTGAGTRVDAAPADAPPADAAPAAGEPARQWRQAAGRVGAAARALDDLPHGDTAAWAAAASDTAGLLSLLADRVDDGELAAELADAAYTLAWSAQTPRHPHTRDHHGGDHRGDHRAPARSDLAEVARFVRVATRRGTAEDAAVAVAIAALVLALLAMVRLIQAWHDHQQHRRQAAALGTRYQRCRLAARAHAGNAAPPWHRRPHGAVGDAALRRQADRAAAELARFTEVEGRAAVLLQQARAGDGPAARQLRDRAAALAAAAAAETELPAARTRLAAALADQDAARARLAELAPLADRGRLALRAHGTNRAQLARDQAAARDRLAAATTTEQNARTRLADLTLQAAAPFTSDQGPPARPAWRDGAATAEHTDLTGRWPEHLAAAIATDVGTAPDRAAGLTAETRAARRILHTTRTRPATATQARERLTELRTEQAIRATLPADRADHEQQQRLQHAAARPQAAPRQSDPHRHHGPDKGPSRGRGGGFGR
ncbi:relaxase/mobilization nuclease domain-containing protein [Actinomadura citrea]|uniref:relaxase/mobilization nuclease domain-containing protein n=1 Tax=Actinomadura citrea TaxID=46158 RepID=UPI003CE55A3D